MANCLKCDKPAEEATQVISGGQFLYDEDGEWVCSDECHAKIEQERRDGPRITSGPWGLE